jgi:hypothetical protein
VSMGTEPSVKNWDFLMNKKKKVTST